MPEVCAILALTRDNGSEKTYQKSLNRFLIQYESNLKDKKQIIPLAALAITKKKIQKSQKQIKHNQQLTKNNLRPF